MHQLPWKILRFENRKSLNGYYEELCLRDFYWRSNNQLNLTLFPFSLWSELANVIEKWEYTNSNYNSLFDFSINKLFRKKLRFKWIVGTNFQNDVLGII
jgi:hypothetical protein